jgi:hypothetical protein
MFKGSGIQKVSVLHLGSGRGYLKRWGNVEEEKRHYEVSEIT